MNNSHKLWFPYSQMKNIGEPHHVVSAEDVYINLSNGKQLVDGISSWWCMIHGYCHPELNEALISQVNKFSHVMLGGVTHEPVLELTNKLVEITPEGLNHVFYGDSGSIGVEIAMKMALQYWRNIGKPEKSKFVALKGGYHGDTIGCMSVCDPEDGMHYLFKDAIVKEYFVDSPPPGYDQENEIIENYICKLQDFFDKHHTELAALIVEPILQIAGGFNIYSPLILKKMREICENYDTLLIFDEIATGFGRTGTYFASNHANVCADIMVLGKALTGGYLGHSATLTTSKIFNAFYDEDPKKAFMHGPTFMGNPLACSVALKSIEIFERDNYLDKINDIEYKLKEGLSKLKSSKINDVRVIGATGVIEINSEKDISGFQDFATENGVWLRPFSKYIYTMPPYIISEQNLDKILSVMQIWFS